MKNALITAGVVAVVALALTAVLFIFFRPAPQTTPSQAVTSGFEPASTQNTTEVGSGSAPAENVATNEPSSVVVQETGKKITKLADGPVAGATILEFGTPTTTLARYVMADTGHTLDLPLGVSGAVARPVSNTTIPSITGVLWEPKGAAAVLQYLDGAVVKTLYVGFPPTSATSTNLNAPTHIRFLPDNIASVAVGPSGSIAYLLTTSAGVDGYTADQTGSNGKKLFSLPLMQVLLSWPAPQVLMIQSKSAAGVPGIAFSVNTNTGALSQLVAAPGLAAIASPDFSRVVYQTATVGATNRAAYAHDTASGTNIPLSFQPIPEKCIWSPLSSVVLYCAVPLSYTPSDYLDLWHQGTSSANDGIISFNVATGRTTIVATPGQDGGSAADIRQLAISPDGQYLLYVTKGAGVLYSVHLTQ